MSARGRKRRKEDERVEMGLHPTEDDKGSDSESSDDESKSGSIKANIVTADDVR